VGRSELAVLTNRLAATRGDPAGLYRQTPTRGGRKPSEPRSRHGNRRQTVLVTGASRGIGRALVAEALARGAARVYAGLRQPLEHPDERVTPLILDITSPEQVREIGRASWRERVESS